MNAIIDGGPAFPVLKTSPLGMYVDQNGMTLRDYFAAKAMQGMFASDLPDWNIGERFAARAKTAYVMADSMLAAREAQP